MWLDSFTIIAPGPSDLDQDGPALVGDPDMGFSGLRQFGPTLTHHTELKVNEDTAALEQLSNCCAIEYGMKTAGVLPA